MTSIFLNNPWTVDRSRAIRRILKGNVNNIQISSRVNKHNQIMIQWNPLKLCLASGNNKRLFFIDKRTNTFKSTKSNVAQRQSMIEWTPAAVENNDALNRHIYVWNLGLPSEVWLWHLKDVDCMGAFG
jgi:hypothetical protein